MEKLSHKVGLILASVFSLWLVWHYVIEFKLNPPSNPNYPDSFASNVSVAVMNKQGLPQYEFFSPQLFHYAVNNRTEFSQPQMTYYQNNQPPWTVTAQQGEALEGDEKVILKGDVFFHQAKGSNNQETSIQTQQLIIHPDTKQAETPDFVLAVQPYSSASGVGMKLDGNAKTLDLLSNVHGMYLPQPPHQGPPVYVTSDSAHMDKSTDVITFLGNAKVKQGSNSYAAPKIEYHIKQQMVVSPETTQGKTKIVIHPNSIKKGQS